MSWVLDLKTKPSKVVMKMTAGNSDKKKNRPAPLHGYRLRLHRTRSRLASEVARPKVHTSARETSVAAYSWERETAW